MTYSTAVNFGENIRAAEPNIQYYERGEAEPEPESDYTLPPTETTTDYETEPEYRIVESGQSSIVQGNVEPIDIGSLQLDTQKIVFGPSKETFGSRRESNGTKSLKPNTLTQDGSLTSFFERQENGQLPSFGVNKQVIENNNKIGDSSSLSFDIPNPQSINTGYGNPGVNRPLTTSFQVNPKGESNGENLSHSSELPGTFRRKQITGYGTREQNKPLTTSFQVNENVDSNINLRGDQQGSGLNNDQQQTVISGSYSGPATQIQSDQGGNNRGASSLQSNGQERLLTEGQRFTQATFQNFPAAQHNAFTQHATQDQKARQNDQEISHATFYNPYTKRTYIDRSGSFVKPNDPQYPGRAFPVKEAVGINTANLDGNINLNFGRQFSIPSREEGSFRVDDQSTAETQGTQSIGEHATLFIARGTKQDLPGNVPNGISLGEKSSNVLPPDEIPLGSSFGIPTSSENGYGVPVTADGSQSLESEKGPRIKSIVGDNIEFRNQDLGRFNTLGQAGTPFTRPFVKEQSTVLTGPKAVGIDPISLYPIQESVPITFQQSIQQQSFARQNPFFTNRGFQSTGSSNLGFTNEQLGSVVAANTGQSQLPSSRFGTVRHTGDASGVQATGERQFNIGSQFGFDTNTGEVPREVDIQTSEGSKISFAGFGTQDQFETDGGLQTAGGRQFRFGSQAPLAATSDAGLGAQNQFDIGGRLQTSGGRGFYPIGGQGINRFGRQSRFGTGQLYTRNRQRALTGPGAVGIDPVSLYPEENSFPYIGQQQTFVQRNAFANNERGQLSRSGRFSFGNQNNIGVTSKNFGQRVSGQVVSGENQAAGGLANVGVSVRQQADVAGIGNYGIFTNVGTPVREGQQITTVTTQQSGVGLGGRRGISTESNVLQQRQRGIAGLQVSISDRGNDRRNTQQTVINTITNRPQSSRAGLFDNQGIFSVRDNSARRGGRRFSLDDVAVRDSSSLQESSRTGGNTATSFRIGVGNGPGADLISGGTLYNPFQTQEISLRDSRTRGRANDQFRGGLTTYGGTRQGAEDTTGVIEQISGRRFDSKTGIVGFQDSSRGQTSQGSGRASLGTATQVSSNRGSSQNSQSRAVTADANGFIFPWQKTSVPVSRGGQTIASGYEGTGATGPKTYQIPNFVSNVQTSSRDQTEGRSTSSLSNGVSYQIPGVENNSQEGSFSRGQSRAGFSNAVTYQIPGLQGSVQSSSRGRSSGRGRAVGQGRFQDDGPAFVFPWQTTPVPTQRDTHIIGRGYEQTGATGAITYQIPGFVRPIGSSDHGRNQGRSQTSGVSRGQSGTAFTDAVTYTIPGYTQSNNRGRGRTRGSQKDRDAYVAEGRFGTGIGVSFSGSGGQKEKVYIEEGTSESPLFTFQNRVTQSGTTFNPFEQVTRRPTFTTRAPATQRPYPVTTHQPIITGSNAVITDSKLDGE